MQFFCDCESLVRCLPPFLVGYFNHSFSSYLNSGEVHELVEVSVEGFDVSKDITELLSESEVKSHIVQCGGEVSNSGSHSFHEEEVGELN